MRNGFLSQRSFTLIELIIVVGLILLFTGFSIATFSSFTELKKIENDSKKIISTLELTKVKTTSGDSSLCGGDDSRVSYFSFETNGSASTYSLIPHCEVGSPTPIYYSLESNVVFFYPTPTTTFKVAFQPITGGTDGCSYIYLKNPNINSGVGVCRYIKISQSGLVSGNECQSCEECDSSCP